MSQPSSPAVHHAADEMTIFTAAQDQPWLLAAAGAGPRAVIDLAAVASVDSAGLQLLVAAKRHARALGNELHFINHSAALREVLTLCGLSAELDGEERA